MNQLNVSPQEAVYEEIKNFTGCKPKGGDRLQQKLSQLITDNSLRLFIPWAANMDGRTTLSAADRLTIDWLFDSNGLVQRISKFGKVSCMLMFADTYAMRNGFDMDSANEYWTNISASISEAAIVSFTATSLLEDAEMMFLRAKNAYAFERLIPAQRSKILLAAAKYSGIVDEYEVYESAAEYSMLRAAEADYVDKQLDALWVSLNWPERDIMCGDVPRIYAPETLRAPWLKE
jgi:hypothetical protein